VNIIHYCLVEKQKQMKT